MFNGDLLQIQVQCPEKNVGFKPLIIKNSAKFSSGTTPYFTTNEFCGRVHGRFESWSQGNLPLSKVQSQRKMLTATKPNTDLPSGECRKPLHQSLPLAMALVGF